MDRLGLYAAALLPSIGVGYLFYVIIRNLLEGDRNERIALARIDKERERETGQASPAADAGRTTRGDGTSSV